MRNLSREIRRGIRQSPTVSAVVEISGYVGEFLSSLFPPKEPLVSNQPSFRRYLGGEDLRRA